MKHKNILVYMIVIFAIVCITSCTNGSVSNRPNIIVFLADDMGYGDASCYGSTNIKTPVLDKLASEGVRFTSFYANAPECTPTRAALLTGRYQQRVGGLECAIGVNNVGRYDDAIRLREANELGLPVSETSIAKMLKDNGYNTGLFGKWHLGYEEKFSPNKHGFDQAFYAIGGLMDYFHYTEPGADGIYSLYENEKIVKREGYFTDLIGEETIKFIDKQSNDKPFFIYVPFTAPHTPYQGPKDYKKEQLSKESPLWGWSGPKDVYLTMVEHMDKVMGNILLGLEKKGFSDNTLIIFMSDNGANPTGSNFPLRGTKGNLFEGGIRVPSVVKWTDKIKPGIVSEQPCLTMDFSSSILRVAGIDEPKNRKFDGIDILEYIEGNKQVKDRTLFWRAFRGVWSRKAVRSGNLKYINLKNDKTTSEYLFDLKNDIKEKNNLILENKIDATKLKMKLAKWEEEVKPIR